MIALLSSMPFESDLILASMKTARVSEVADKKVYKGSLSGVKVLLLNTGIGKINAAHSATIVIENFPVNKVVNFGIGGAYPGSGLVNGDVAIASKEILGDEGVISSKGWEGLEKIGIPLVQSDRKKYFNEFPVGKLRLQKIKSGTFVTVSAASGSTQRAKELERRFRAICENMEGAAIAQICMIYNIPMFEIRGISNIAGVRDKRRWDMELASLNCQKAVMKAIGSLK
ncbi:futalosine hydrolase [bacterium BMS3Bbin09]|nr:futalosine hydrolase [bacterium BMS3Bbin09]HDN94806.1 futalosine hydrolase [Nitrospirota bacterium]